MSGIISIKYDLSCYECQEVLDYMFDGNHKYIIGLRCSECGHEWQII